MSEDRPSYEDAREELVDVVRRLESGGANLEDSLALWERGEKLAQICQELARRRQEAARRRGRRRRGRRRELTRQRRLCA